MKTAGTNAVEESGGILHTLKSRAEDLLNLRLKKNPSANFKELASELLDALFPLMSSKYVDTFTRLVKTIVGLEEALQKANKQLKKKTHEVKVIREYHTILLKKYRLLVSPEEFKQHMNMYDKTLTVDITIDEDDRHRAMRAEKMARDDQQAIQRIKQKVEEKIAESPVIDRHTPDRIRKREQMLENKPDPVFVQPSQVPQTVPLGKSPTVMKSMQQSMKLPDSARVSNYHTINLEESIEQPPRRKNEVKRDAHPPSMSKEMMGISDISRIDAMPVKSTRQGNINLSQ